MYEVGLSKSFEAWHVMPDMAGPEGELHSHDYRLDVVISRHELDERGMVCDIDVLTAALDKIVGAIEGQNLDVIDDGTSGGVTVEVLARWAHDRLASELALDAELSVRAWESPVAFGGYAGPMRSS